MAKCSSCGADIFWSVTSTGKKIPIDSEPRKDGNIFISNESAVYITANSPESEATTPRYVSHFATCPQSKDWRKKDKS